MNQSDLQKMRDRLQARQAQAHDADTLGDAIAGGAALVVFFLILAFI